MRYIVRKLSTCSRWQNSSIFEFSLKHHDLIVSSSTWKPTHFAETSHVADNSHFLIQLHITIEYLLFAQWRSMTNGNDAFCMCKHTNEFHMRKKWYKTGEMLRGSIQKGNMDGLVPAHKKVSAWKNGTRDFHDSLNDLSQPYSYGAGDVWFQFSSIQNKLQREGNWEWAGTRVNSGTAVAGRQLRYQEQSISWR